MAGGGAAGPANCAPVTRARARHTQGRRPSKGIAAELRGIRAEKLPEKEKPAEPPREPASQRR